MADPQDKTEDVQTPPTRKAVIVLSERGMQRRQARKEVRARYDAAQTTDDNRRHWAAADNLSPAAANTSQIRQTLRSRARYETANNCYARGLINTLANDTVGTGPRLQLLLDDADPDVVTAAEQAFTQWANSVDLAGKLRTMRMAKAQDGEAFAMLVTNTGIGPVQLDLRLIEADQIATSNATGTTGSDSTTDGIVYDDAGNPETYHVLKDHPGGSGTSLAHDDVDAKDMIHWYRTDRPGQRRGIPEIMPALGLFAQMRRFTLAVLDAAELAADFAGILYTESPANGEAAEVEPMDTIELERRMITTLPDGWKIEQMQARQPCTTYGEFKSEILKEIARCLSIPFNIVAGTSAGYNYASGRLDHQVYFKAIRIEQSIIETTILDRLLEAWLAEAINSDRALGPIAILLKGNWNPPHQWFWDGPEHVDPAKEAAAQEKRLINNTTTLAQEYASKGLDWEKQLRQRAKEKALIKELGLEETPPAPPAPPGDNDADADDDAEKESRDGDDK